MSLSLTNKTPLVFLTSDILACPVRGVYIFYYLKLSVVSDLSLFCCLFSLLFDVFCFFFCCFTGSADKEGRSNALKKTVQVSNLSPLLTVDQLKQLFGLYGTVVECSVTDSKHFAYIEYSKPEEANAALGLNNMDVAGRPLNVEMAKSLPPKPAILSSSLTSSSLPLMMQQAVAMQQMQFQQALLMQQTLTTQQAANRAASMKTATDLAAARAAEISKSLNPSGLVAEDKEADRKSRYYCNSEITNLLVYQ